MNFKMTVRRRKPDGSLETATYKLEHLHSSGDDENQALLLALAEMQANTALDFETMPVRVWIEEIE